MLFCVLLQDFSSAEPDDEDERVSLVFFLRTLCFLH